MGVRLEGKALRFTCFDGVYTESLTLDQARRSDVVVALDMQTSRSPTSAAARCGSTSP
ncbi:hypothetical protein [Nonomuraea rubra]|uniref:hypothetical protein n=1 Tax=Nonomuraea rubra TaxID=46180 RepID=UPI0036128C1C